MSEYRAPHDCHWAYDIDGYWQTECKQAFCFTDDGPTANKAKFCQYCGGNLIELPDSGDGQHG